MIGNPWKRPFVPTHRKPKDRLKRAQLAPRAAEATRCGRCGHPPGLHPDEIRDCEFPDCYCPSFMEVTR